MIARRVVRAVAAWTVLAALVVGVPLALARFVGWPLPRSFPTWSSVVGSIQRSGVEPTVVVKTLAVVLWVCWARLAVAVAVSIVATVRRRPVPTIRGLGSAQRWAASLLASATMLTSFVGVARGAGAAGRDDFPVVAVTVAWAGGGGSAADSVATAIPSAPAPVPPPTGTTRASTWTVARNDSLWRIAERALGDGIRWREVLGANLGREVAPGVVFADPDQALQPGWVLRLPGVTDPGVTASTSSTPDDPADPAVVEPVVVVERGDTLSSLAAEAYDDPDLWPRIWAANRGRTVGHERLDDPNRLLPGWTIVIPRGPAAARATDGPVAVAESGPDPEGTTLPAGSPAESAASVTRDAVHRVSTVADRPTGDRSGLVGRDVLVPAAAPVTAAAVPDGPAPATGCPAPTVIGSATDDGSSVPLGLGAATMLASGVAALVATRRRRALRAATFDARTLPPARPLIDLEQTLRAASADELVARLDLAVRGACAGMAERDDPGRIVAWWADRTGALTARFEGPAPLPFAPFRPSADGWVLPAEVATAEIPAGPRFGPFPCPALVQLGRWEDRDLYVDLETVGLLGIDGGRRHARSVVTACVSALAVSPFAVRCGLLLVGLDPAIAGGSETVADLDTALERAAELAGPLLGRLPSGMSAATWRSGSAGEPWEPVVLAVGADSVSPGLASELVAFGAHAGRGLGIVTDAPGIRSRWTLRQLDDRWLLDPLGIELQPVGIAAPAADQLASLLAGAERPIIDVARPKVDPVVGSFPEPERSLVVRCFGAPAVVGPEGGEVGFARTKALELVVWMSRHRRSATRSGARAALWESEVANGTFANVVSDARNSLAASVPAPDGEQWIARTLTEQLPLHPLIVSDVELVEQRLAWARRQDPAAARVTLAAALDLVVGPPFAGAPYLWPDAEGLVSQDTLLATTVAAELAELHLAAHDLAGVFRSTAVGLAVLPGHEELLSLRMRAHAAAGDLAAVRKEWEGYERVITADPFGDGEPSARLVRLRNDLLGVRRAG